MASPRTLPNGATLPALAANGLVLRHPFRAMNTDVAVLLGDCLRPEPALEVELLFHSLERRFSRFLPDSELCRLNRRRGSAVRVSPAMLALLRLARRLSRLTGGVFEPAVLPQLEAAGYNRSFDLVDDLPEARPSPAIGASIRRVRLRRRPPLALLPPGLRLDFGGIGKGFAVDCAARLLRGSGGFLVDAGGDIYAGGRDPQGQPWRIGVADPWGGDDLQVIELSDAAIATSTVHKRRWRSGDSWANHLIDPRTGAPVENGVGAVSVIAPSAALADVFAKSALILGPEAGSHLIESQGCAALFLLSSGATLKTAAWPEA